MRLKKEMSRREATEKKLVDTNTKLKQAFVEIKTLQGILPICSYCKKIRDDKGNWEQIETYVHRHSDAAFTHGICPDCMKEHHPQVRPP
jgi:hypothetical protein